MITMINNAYYYDKVSQQWKKIGSEFIIDSYPVGSFLLWSGTHRYPSGFMECKGQLLNKADYPELFSVIEYTYGGSGNRFNLPKFDDGRFFRSTGGNAAALGQVQQDELKSHSHDISVNTDAMGNAPTTLAKGKTEIPGNISGYIRNAGGIETRPYNSSVIVLIKVKTIVERIPVDNDPYATEIKAGIFKITNEITGSRNDVVVTEKAVANNTLSFEPYNKVEVDVFELRGANVALQGTVYLSDKSSVPGRYLNTTKVIEAKLTKAQQKANGTYFIKVKQDNSLELVNIRPEFHQKSTTAEYYLDGVWYDKTGARLQPQTYLPYSVTITSNNITAVNFENIYPSSKELGVGQTWQNVTAQRQKDIVYTNTTNRPIIISVTGVINISSEDIQLSINNVVMQRSNIGSRSGYVCAVVPVGATYKITTSSNSQINPSTLVWMELR